MKAFVGVAFLSTITTTSSNCVEVAAIAAVDNSIAGFDLQNSRVVEDLMAIIEAGRECSIKRCLKVDLSSETTYWL
jgi:hypothetical protein